MAYLKLSYQSQQLCAAVWKAGNAIHAIKRRNGEEEDLCQQKLQQFVAKQWTQVSVVVVVVPFVQTALQRAEEQIQKKKKKNAENTIMSADQNTISKEINGCVKL